MEGSCSTGQSPQWAVVPVEEEDFKIHHNSGKSHDFQYSYSEWGLLIQQPWNGFENKVDRSSTQYFTKRIII
jgi:hypothetical protein